MVRNKLNKRPTFDQSSRKLVRFLASHGCYHRINPDFGSVSGRLGPVESDLAVFDNVIDVNGHDVLGGGVSAVARPLREWNVLLTSETFSA